MQLIDLFLVFSPTDKQFFKYAFALFCLSCYDLLLIVFKAREQFPGIKTASKNEAGG